MALSNGVIVAAASEERFTRKKGDAASRRTPWISASRGGRDGRRARAVGFYDKPLLKFERILETYLGVAPSGFRSFVMAGPLWIKEKLFTDRQIRSALGGYDGPLLYAEHHESHAASASCRRRFRRRPSSPWTAWANGPRHPWEWAAVRLDADARVRWPDSLGLLYSAFTAYTGFKVNSGEYKVMGLAPYGEPKYVRAHLDDLIDLKEDGSFRLNQCYFNYLAGSP